MRSFNAKNIRNWIISLAIVASVGGVALTMAAPQVTNAATLADKCNQGFLGFPSWYRGLTIDDGTNKKCDIKSPSATENGLSKFIWTIGLNVLEIVVVAVAYLSSFYFLYGGWLFIISQGKPEGAAKARLTMTQAAIGLIVSITAVAFMNFIVDKVINLT